MRMSYSRAGSLAIGASERATLSTRAAREKSCRSPSIIEPIARNPSVTMTRFDPPIAKRPADGESLAESSGLRGSKSVAHARNASARTHEPGIHATVSIWACTSTRMPSTRAIARSVAPEITSAACAAHGARSAKVNSPTRRVTTQYSSTIGFSTIDASNIPESPKPTATKNANRIANRRSRAASASGVDGTSPSTRIGQKTATTSPIHANPLTPKATSQSKKIECTLFTSSGQFAGFAALKNSCTRSGPQPMRNQSVLKRMLNPASM